MPEKYFGRYVGTVVDNQDPENEGKLTLRVPTIYGQDETVEDVRPALPYGLFLLPEVGMNVWVEFQGGDPGLPLWTGIQYSPGEWAQEGEGEPKKRIIKTSAGNTIILHDDGENEGIEIISQGHLTLRCTGTIVIKAPNVIINGRVVAPRSDPI